MDVFEMREYCILDIVNTSLANYFHKTVIFSMKKVFNSSLFNIPL